MGKASANDLKSAANLKPLIKTNKKEESSSSESDSDSGSDESPPAKPVLVPEAPSVKAPTKPDPRKIFEQLTNLNNKALKSKTPLLDSKKSNSLESIRASTSSDPHRSTSAQSKCPVSGVKKLKTIVAPSPTPNV